LTKRGSGQFLTKKRTNFLTKFLEKTTAENQQKKLGGIVSKI
jgi:hypothetical protein